MVVGGGGGSVVVVVVDVVVDVELCISIIEAQADWTSGLGLDTDSIFCCKVVLGGCSTRSKTPSVDPVCEAIPKVSVKTIRLETMIFLDIRLSIVPQTTLICQTCYIIPGQKRFAHQPQTTT